MACIIRGCKSRMGAKDNEAGIVSFHKIPNITSPVRQEWIDFICNSLRGESLTFRKSHRVCSNHFTEDCFVLRKDRSVSLKENAVPTKLTSTPTESATTHGRQVVVVTSDRVIRPRILKEQFPFPVVKVASNHDRDVAETSDSVDESIMLPNEPTGGHARELIPVPRTPDELENRIVTLQNNCLRVERLATNRLLSINALRQRIRRLEITKVNLTSKVVELMEKEKTEINDLKAELRSLSQFSATSLEQKYNQTKKSLQNNNEKENDEPAVMKIKINSPRSESSFFDEDEEPEVSEDLLVCRVCFAVDVQLYAVTSRRLQYTFAELTGQILSAEDGLPRRLCEACLSTLTTCTDFREQCLQSYSQLQNLVKRGPLTMKDIKTLDQDSNETNDPSQPNENNMKKQPVLAVKPLIKAESGDEKCKDITDFIEVEYLEIDDPENDISVIDPDYSENKLKNEVEEDKFPNDNANDTYNDEIEDSNDSNQENDDGIKSDTSDDIQLKQKVLSQKLNMLSRSSKDVTSADYKFVRKIASKVGDDVYPLFNYEAFEKEWNVTIKFLTKSEQMKEIEERKNNSKTKYCCDLCGKGYNHESTMKRHLTFHDPSVGPHECDVCHYRFRLGRKLRSHRDLHRLTFTCDSCGCVTRDRAAAKLHYMVHQGKKYACPHCMQEYDLRASYYNHIRLVHPGKNVACDQCGETFLSERGVWMHKALGHKIKAEFKSGFKCPECSVVFLTSAALDRHTSVSAGVSHAALWPCGTCGDSCGSEAARAAHNEELHPPDRLRCDECDKTFANATSFDTHVKRKHLNQRATKSINQRRRFVRRVPGPKEPVVCEICGRVVKNETLLRIHMDKHVRPFACTKCPKTFPCNFTRECHMRVHTGERPFQCAECPLRFALQRNLSRHHKVVHLNQRANVPCELCSKTFATRTTMLLHVKYVHNNMPWPKRERKPKKTVDSNN